MNTAATAKTFGNDLHLPALPYSNIELSLKIYIDSLDAILPLHLFHKYKDDIENLISTDGQYLDFCSKKVFSNLKNWIENWWLNWYHLSSNIELIPYCSISGISTLHKGIWPEDKASQITRGAQYLYALLVYWSCLRYELIKPERTKNGEMMSMNMYRSIFNCSRIPTNSSDEILRYFHTACEGSCPNHILLCIKGYVFKVNFIEKDIIWPLEKITEVITEIFAIVKDRELSNNVTSITTMEKPRVFAAMELSIDDSDFMKEVQNSILWLSFDASEPPLEHMLLSAIGSDCQNRCGFKSLSITVFSNGLISLNADSAVLDPDVFINVILFADFHISKNLTTNDYPLPYKYLKDMVLSPNNYREYDLYLPNNVNAELLQMRRMFNMKVYQMDCSYRHFKWFNQVMAKKWNLDSAITVHLLIMLTYWGIHKDISSSCAIVSHRKYYRGRHDIVPTLNIDSLTWIKAVHSLKCPNNKLKALFLLAHRKLQSLFKFCENNCSPILYLNYLNSTFRDNSKYLRDMCNDNFWYKSGYSGHFGIRTIYLGENHIVTVVPDVTRFGYSVSYSVDNNSTLISVIHRCGEDQLNPRLPRIFLKEFLTSTETLNQMFAS